jgi:hypothetical protein
MDITEVILSDHHGQRRMFALLDDVDRSDVKTLTMLWNRLSAMLEVHAQAEELFFYPELLALGRRLRDDSEAAETKDAIGDHNDIRDGILRGGGEVSTPPVTPTTSTWARRSTRACGTSASTSTSIHGTGSPCRSWPTRPSSSPACRSRTRTRTATSRTGATATGLGRLSK